MPIAELFLGLYNHRAVADFSEDSRDELDAITLLFPLNFDETGDQIKQILEKRYTDGISGFEGVRVEGSKILGVFYDIVSPSLTKKFNFSIDAKSGDVDYTQIDTGNLDTSFSEYSFATKGKSKQCKEGKSSACKRPDGSVYCIKVGYKCKSVGLSSEEKTVSQEIVSKSKAKPVFQKSVDDTKSITTNKKSSIQSTLQTQQLSTTENTSELKPATFDQKTSKQLKQWLSVAYENMRKDDSLKLKINNGIAYQVGALADAGNFVGVKDAKGNLQAGAIVKEGKDHVYVDYLVTAPWNVSSKNDKRKVKGAGTSAIASIIQKSIDAGYGGKVKLDALPGAISFYEKIGFKKTKRPKDAADGVWSMELSPQKAKEFLSKVE